MDEETQIKKLLEELEQEHQAVQAKLEHIINDGHHDQLNIQRLKRQKLQLKDKISYLREHLYDDIIA